MCGKASDGVGLGVWWLSGLQYIYRQPGWRGLALDETLVVTEEYLIR